MFALGHIQSLKCNMNASPTGITTHKWRLQRACVAFIVSLRSIAALVPMNEPYPDTVKADRRTAVRW
jgi:hypothetical protein